MGTMRIEPGSSALTCGSTSRMLCATSTAFAPARPKAHVDALILHGIDRRGDIAQIDRRTAGAADDQVVVLIGALELYRRPQDRGAGAAVELSGAGVARAGFNRGAQIIHRDAAGPHRRRSRLDPDRGLRAVDVYSRDAGQDAEALAHLRARVIVELTGRHGIAGHGDVHD